MPVLRANPSMLLTEEEKKKRMFGSLKFIGRNRKVNDNKNTREDHPRKSKSDVKANAKERATMNLKKTGSESKKKAQEEALRRSKRIEEVKSSSETPKRCSTVDQPRSRLSRRCTLKASSTRNKNIIIIEPRHVKSFVERIQTQEVLTSTNSISTTPISSQTSVRRNESLEFFMRKHKRSVARKSPNSEDATPQRVSSFYRNKHDRWNEMSASKLCSTEEECTTTKSQQINIEHRHSIVIDEQRVGCAPTKTEEIDSDEETGVVDTPTVARNCNEGSCAVTSSPVQAQSLSESHSDGSSPKSEWQLHELSAYLSPSPTITTDDVKNAMRNVNNSTSVPPTSSLEQFVQSVTGLVSQFGYGNLNSQPRMASSFSMSPPPSPAALMNDRGIGPAKSLVPDLPPLDINLVQFFMQMWQMWNKAGEMAAAHVAAMNIVGTSQATLAPTSGTPPPEHPATRQFLSRTIVEQVVSAPMPTVPAESLPFTPRHPDILGSPQIILDTDEPIAQMPTRTPQNEESGSEADLETESSDQDVSQESASLSTEPTVEEISDGSSTGHKSADPKTIPFEQPSEQQPQHPSSIELLDSLRISSLPVRQVPNAKLIRRLTGPPTVSWPFEGPLKRKNTQLEFSNVKRTKFAETALEVDKDALSDKMCVLCQQKEANTYIKPCKCAFFCMSCAVFWKDDVKRCPVHEKISIKKICGMRR